MALSSGAQTGLLEDFASPGVRQCIKLSGEGRKRREKA